MSHYSEKLLNPRWQKKRLEILQRDKWSCQICLDKSNTLHVHHLVYHGGLDPWDYEDKDLLTLCDAHHDVIHAMEIPVPIILLWKDKKELFEPILPDKLNELFKEFISHVIAVKGTSLV